ncbi:MAG: hypothetical protein NTV74_06780 [Euryarchaeota archaeon]|nr:hypothetical protein [Euryarchaeota archaeon]
MKKIIAIGAIILFLGAAFVPSITSQTPEKTGIEGGMRIDFHEYDLSEENLRKAALIDFPSTIYLSASSLEEFRVLEEKLHEINPDLEAAYIPHTEKSHFISPYSYPYELENLIKDLQKNKQNKTLKVLLDLEPPRYDLEGKNLTNFIKNLKYFHKNKKLIESIFERANEYNITIFTGEAAPENIFDLIKLNLKGRSYSLNKFAHTRCIMFYSNKLTNRDEDRKAMENFLIKLHDRHADKIQVILGNIGPTSKTGTIITFERLDDDLKFFYEHGFKTVSIFRLAGLNEDYLRVIKKYVT